MKRTLVTVALLAMFLAGAAYAQTNWTKGWTSRYWDGCKPSCSWNGNAGGNPCKECNQSNNEINPPSQSSGSSSCDGGNSYTCWDMIPFRDPDDPNKAYAFGATPGQSIPCGTCFEIKYNGQIYNYNERTFTNGYATHQALKDKVLIVKASNIGYDVRDGQFDLLIPGGGLGAYDSFSKQLGLASNVNAFHPSLGERYGGLLANCERQLNWSSGSLSAYQTCLRNACNDVFKAGNHAQLREGCLFYADWFMAANNPGMEYRQVTCPAILTNRYKPGSGGSVATPPITGGGGGTPVVNYTLTINRNPANIGTVTPASGGSHAANTPVAISATAPSGYRFVNWTLTGSNASIANANNASTTVTLTGNATITANFQQTYTLTVSRAPANGGATNPTGAQSNIAAGTQVNISATPASGYTFTNWTFSGSGTIANANSASTSVTVNGNITVTANFAAIPVSTNYTLTINRIPAAGGTVTPASGQSHAAGTPVTISATPASGYTFTNWTVTSGSGAAIANANSATTTVTLTANATITANFALIPPTPTNYTLTVNRSPSIGGTTTPASGHSHAAGTPVAISANPASGYAFVNWTIAGSATIANVNERITTITLSGNAIITANFQEEQGGGANCAEGEVILTRTVVPAGSRPISVTP